MAVQYSMGHAMCRRSGVPSNSLEAAGTNMARSHQTSDEAHGDAGMGGSHRISIGDAYAVTAPGPLAGTPVARGNTQSQDPTAGGAGNRANVEYTGASYRIQPKATFVQIDPSAGPTMANARIIPSVQGRVSPNFDSGMQTSY